MKKNTLTIILISILTCGILFFIFKPILQHPNGYLYSTSGDAVKSYFNFSFYLKYDDGIKHDGINYPYGDHLQYINSHPLYVQVVKFVDKFYPIANYGVGILNLTMILSLLLTVPFLFLLLRHYSLPRWYAAILSIILLFLTPQFDRIHGHFEMVYAFFLPMFWYFLIQFRDGKRKILWGALLVSAGLIGGFTSAYYAAFFSIFLFGVLVVDLWKNKNNFRGYWKSGLQLFIIAVLPLLIVKGLVSLTDWVIDRPNNPYGFYVYHANFLSVFLPFNSEIKSLLGKHINMDFQWEGRAYVGLPASILAVSIFFTGFYNLFSKKKISWKIFAPGKNIHTYFFASILILLFAMCIPFKYGFGFIIDIIPPIGQFRALGRFTWIFYYIFTAYTAIFFYKLYRFLKLKRMSLLGILLLIFVIGYWSIDAGTNIRRSTRGLLNKNDKLESSDSEYLARFKDAGVNPKDFQAIFFLPYASTCGDKLLFEKGMNAFNDAMKCSYHTQLPLIQSFSPRLSFSNALSSIQMLGHPAIPKTRLNDMNAKPILLVCTKEKMNADEAWLQSKAEVFWEDKYITLSKLPISVFHDSHQQWLDEAKLEIAGLEGKGDILLDSSTKSILTYNYNDKNTDIKFSGNGAMTLRKGRKELINKVLDDSWQKGTYELSFWLYVDGRKFDMPKADLKIVDVNGTNKLEKRLNTREVHDVYNHWIRISESFNLEPGNKIQLWMKGEYIAIDDILLRPVNASVLVKTNGKFNLLNNYPLPLN